ncbi:hypothetical protein J1N35_036026 [Gossypium stocksii]|uniref:Uncharacterized protein n=1 Tax=Gossypium stocksii TaxID=47602 RepID=A0A9D3UUY3_9ROSI|nr:hypothetical protein J1N35_036026 [Gossypium stocksii]
MNEEFLYRMAAIYKCKIGVLPICYLGIPLGADPRRVATWEVVVKRFRKMSVKLLGSYKSLWLIAIAASCCSIWLARNEIVFENKVLSMDTLIFHFKMMVLLWVRTAFDECRIQERLWWFCPYKCSFPKSVSRGWCYPLHGWLKFNIRGIASEGALGSGGVTRYKEDLERRIVCVGELSFSIAELNGNEMADTLAFAGISRPSMFKASY